jgi:hypothetical protein
MDRYSVVMCLVASFTTTIDSRHRMDPSIGFFAPYALAH